MNVKNALFACLLLFGLVLACDMPVNAQPQTATLGTWEVQSVQPYQLRGISMVNATDGWAVGFESFAPNNAEVGSVLLRWNGSSWNRITSPINRSLYAVRLVSGSEGWAVGAQGARLRWNGMEWINYSCTTVNCQDLYAVAYVDPNNVWAAGKNVIEHWNGTSWSQSTIQTQYTYTSIAVVSSSDIWAVGRYGTAFPYQMLIAHWNEENWSHQNINNGTFGLSSVDSIGASEIWATGNSYISHYTGNWEYNYVSNPILTSIDMLSSSDGWVVGGTKSILSESLSLILHWDGVSWATVANPGDKTLLKVDMLNVNQGWAIGHQGLVMHYIKLEKVFIPLVIKS